MSARDVMAKAVYEHWNNVPACSTSHSWDDLQVKLPGQHADFLRKVGAQIDALTAAGYTIVRRDEVREAALEEAASYVEGKGGMIPGANAFAPLVSGNRQPCMSGDARDRMYPHTRREFDDAMASLATAIRSLKKKEANQ